MSIEVKHTRKRGDGTAADISARQPEKAIGGCETPCARGLRVMAVKKGQNNRHKIAETIAQWILVFIARERQRRAGKRGAERVDGVGRVEVMGLGE